MGNAAIYYYPDLDDTLERISLGERLSELTIDYDSAYSARMTLGGGIYGVPSAPQFRVRVLWEDVAINSSSIDLYASLYALQSHYQRGGLIYVTSDTDKTFASVSRSSTPIKRGSDAFSTRGNAFGTWETESLSSGDIIALHGSSPDFRYECLKLTSFSSSGLSVMNFSSGTRHEYERAPTIIRHYRFFPCCRRPEGESGQILFEERGRTFTLDMPLVMDMQALAVCAGAGSDRLKGTTAAGVQTADRYYLDNVGLP